MKVAYRLLGLESSKPLPATTRTLEPLETVPVDFKVSEGKALTGSFALLEGHDVMKDAARVYTSSKSRGSSKGWAKGTSPFAARR